MCCSKVVLFSIVDFKTLDISQGSDEGTWTEESPRALRKVDRLIAGTPDIVG